MKNIVYHYQDKSEFGDGPWQNEPDKMQWVDEKTGLPCLIVRGPLGALCGYVGVPRDHPFYEKDYDSVDVNVHGGLTFAGKCGHHICHTVEEGEEDDVWWLGFDCGHFMDVIPRIKRSLERVRKPGERHLYDEEVGGMGRYEYRDVAYVKKECADLAGQLKAVK